IISGQADAVPALEVGTLKDPEWRARLKRLAPRAYKLFVQTAPRGPTGLPTGLEAPPRTYPHLRQPDPEAGEPASVTFDPPPFNPEGWRGKLSATVLVRPAGEQSLAGTDYRVSYNLANYGSVAVASGKLAPDGKIALENIAPSGTNPVGGQYTVEV